MPWAGVWKASVDGNMVRMSDDAMRALGTLVARKTRSPNGVNVYTSIQRSRREWERAANSNKIGMSVTAEASDYD